VSIGSFQAFDYFGDGSFYLLDAPGHAIGHMGGLARTTSSPDSYILMGGDICHHGGELRPSPYMPLPDQISPNPLQPSSTIPCPGAMFEEIHPRKSRTEPFFRIAKPGNFDVEKAANTLNKVKEVDGREEIFVVIAHDQSLMDVVEFFPSKANDWKSKEWGKNGKWAFLKDFQAAVKA